MISERKNNIKIFKTVEALNETVANLIVETAEESVKTNGRFILSLSGGNTPKSLYTLLSVYPYRDLIPWNKTFVFWVDERCVPMNYESNNAHMASEYLFKKIEIPAANIFPVKVNLTPSGAAENYEQMLKDFFGKNQPVFDIILLGLGENGHTASLFPNTSVLFEKSHWVKEVFVEELQMYRITMTVPIINKARNIFILITGKEKSGILRTVFTVPDKPQKYPVQLIKPENGEIIWFADNKAASKLIKIQPEAYNL